MKIKKIIFLSVLLCSGYINVSAELNNFGISNIIPTHADDNDTFDQRISEELTNNNNLIFKGRHTESFTIQDILNFIHNVKLYFNNLLNTDNKNSDDFELVKLAIIDIEKAKKMLKPQDVTPYQEHLLRDSFNPLKTKVNAYKHTDNDEGSSYIRS